MDLPPTSPGEPERMIVQYVMNLCERMLCFSEEDGQRMVDSILYEVRKIRLQEQSRAWAAQKVAGR